MFRRSFFLRSFKFRRWHLPTGYDTGIKVRNSLVEQKSLVPLIVGSRDQISMCAGRWQRRQSIADTSCASLRYTCGPTVYDAAHVGHARNFVSVDILQRLLQDYFGLRVKSVMNITDVDDKLIDRANELGVNAFELAKRWEADFKSDLTLLNIRFPDEFTNVTNFIPQCVKLIEEILDAGFAYKVNGSVYFDVKAMLDTSTHARLMPSRLQKLYEQAKAYKGQTENNNDKQAPQDFALWKATLKEDPYSWNSPFGQGRPGWHIECSAMARSVFGNKLDIHCGGEDLKFPHNENEILQCEAVNTDRDKQWPNYFLHIGHLHVEGKKMSKSLKNFTTVKDFLKTNTSDEFRWFCLMNRFDKPVEWKNDRSNDSITYLNKTNEFLNSTQNVIQAHSNNNNCLNTGWNEKEWKLYHSLQSMKVSIDQHLRSNFDTLKVVEELDSFYSLMATFLRNDYRSDAIDIVVQSQSYVRSLLTTFGLQHVTLFNALQAANNENLSTNDKFISGLVHIRSQLRSLTNSSNIDQAEIYKLCDTIRQDILQPEGIHIKDQPDGKSTWLRKK